MEVTPIAGLRDLRDGVLFADLAENAPAMLWAGDAQGKCVYLNAAMRRFWGVGDDLSGFDWNATVHPDDVCQLAGPFLEGMRGQTPFEVEARYRRHDGVWRILRTHAVPRFDRADGLFLGMYGTNVDITDILAAQKAAAAGASFKDAMLDAALDAIVTIDHEGRVLEFNAAAERIFGFRREDVLGALMEDFIVPPHMREAHRNGLRRFIETGVSTVMGRHLQLPALRADGSEFPAEVAIVPIAGAEPPVFTAFLRDITERKRAEDENRILMGELNHRTKNLLSVVQAVAQQTARQTPPAGFLDVFAARLVSLAASNDLLVRENWSTITLSALVHAQLRHVEGLIGSRIFADGPAQDLGPSTAQILGMAVHELSTNSMKYGALSSEDGRVDIGWRHAEREGEPCLFLEWRESGGPRVAAPDGEGFGQSMLVSYLSLALGGDVELSFAAEGVRWRLTAPAARLEA